MDRLPPSEVRPARAPRRSVWAPFGDALRADMSREELFAEFARHAVRELAGVRADAGPASGGNDDAVDETEKEGSTSAEAQQSSAAAAAASPPASEAKRRRTTADAAGALSSPTSRVPPPPAAADSAASRAWARAVAAAAAAEASAAAPTPPPAGEDCVSALCGAADASRRMRASTRRPPPPPPTQPAAASFMLGPELRRDVTVATRQEGACRAAPPPPPRDAAWGRLFAAVYSNDLQLGTAVALQGAAAGRRSSPSPPPASSHSRTRVLSLACRCCCGPDCGDSGTDGATGVVPVPVACRATLSAACFAAWRAAGGTRPGGRRWRSEEEGSGGEDLLHVSAEFTTPAAVRRRRLVLARCPEGTESRCVVRGFEDSAEAVPWHGRQLSGGAKVESGGIGLVEVALSSPGGNPLRTLGRGRFRVGRSAGFDVGCCSGCGSGGVVRVKHSSCHHACGDIDLKRLTATVGGVGLDALCLDGSFDDACDEAIAILLGSYLVFNDGGLPGEDAS